MSVCRMGESGLVIWLAHAQCSVIEMIAPRYLKFSTSSSL